MTQPKTHDYTRRRWGHDYVWRTEDGGLTGKVTGWGEGISVGDYLIFENGAASSTRYRVTAIRYESDPPDMWWAEVEFAPRPKVSNLPPESV